MVPHLKVVLVFKMESSTSCVTLDSFWFSRFVFKVFCAYVLSSVKPPVYGLSGGVKESAMRVTAKPFLTSLLKAPLMSGDSLTPSTRKTSMQCPQK